MHVCLLCTNGYANADTLLAHYGRDHDERLRFTVDVYGTVCPQCGDTFKRLDGHSARTHRWPIAVLFQAVRIAGDPHGVVAARVRHLMQFILSDLESRTEGLGEHPGRDSRRAQGLPDTVTDEAALGTVAGLLDLTSEVRPPR